MNSSFLQLLVLAGIAVFLVLKLRSVLGTRDGFERPAATPSGQRPDLRVIAGGAETDDRDILDHVPADSTAAKALTRMRQIEPSFSLTEFLRGARGAYEMILTSFEKGEMEPIRPFLSDEVEASFGLAIQQRDNLGHKVEMNFVGVREISVVDAEYDGTSREGEITLRLIGELTRVVRDSAGQIVSGAPTEVIRQRDIWTFARVMGANDPNWQLVATGD